jgi:hypothetical protein
VILPLRDPALHRPMVLVWHRHRVSAPGRAFLDLAEVQDDAASRAGGRRPTTEQLATDHP